MTVTTQSTAAATRRARLTGKQVQDRLAAAGFHCSEVARKGDAYVARDGFFYRREDCTRFAVRLATAAPGVVVTGCGEKWKEFRGGDSVAQGSHLWATFTVPADWSL